MQNKNKIYFSKNIIQQLLALAQLDHLADKPCQSYKKKII